MIVLYDGVDAWDRPKSKEYTPSKGWVARLCGKRTFVTEVFIKPPEDRTLSEFSAMVAFACGTATPGPLAGSDGLLLTAQTYRRTEEEAFDDWVEYLNTVLGNLEHGGASIRVTPRSAYVSRM